MLLLFVTTFLSVTFFILFFGRRYEERRRIRGRLGHREQAQLDSPQEKKTPYERLVRPLFLLLSGPVSSLTSQSVKSALRVQLMQAGNPWDLQVHEFRSIKFILGFFGILLSIILGLGAFFSLVLFVMGFVAPDFFLKRSVAARQSAILKALPDVLDLLTVSIEAGLGFDSAINKVVEKTKGPLAWEFARLLQEIRMGKPRRDALRNLSTRTGVEDLHGFVAAIIQADQLGVSIGKVLRIQSGELRRKRRQRAEEMAMKAPIKIMFPLIILVFPAIFIVLLGPALLSVMAALF